MRPIALAASLVLLAAPGQAELFRCVDPSGRARFTDDPSSCSGAASVEPHRELIQMPPSGAAPAAAAGAASDLERMFPAGGQTWEVVHEAPAAPDTELRNRGLRATRARHYTRARGPVSEVCTVELWAFEEPAQAEAVATELARPDWKILRADATLILLHGVRLERGVGSRRGLVDGCAALGERARAAARAS